MYLVTGGAGFIGSNLVAALVKRGDRVVVNDFFGSNDKWRNIAKHDIDDFVAPNELDQWLNTHMQNIEAIVHMGGISSTTETDVDLILASNFKLSKKLWDWSAVGNVPFIYASSAAVYGDGSSGFADDLGINVMSALRPLNPYGWSKFAFDCYVLRSAQNNRRVPKKWAGLRFFNVYGPNEYHKGPMRSIPAANYANIVAGMPLRLFRSYRQDVADGGQKRDFIYVEDCVGVITWLLDNPVPSSIYNIGSGTARTWVELGRALFKAIGRPESIEFIDMPESLRARYQYFTEAEIRKLLTNGFPHRMRTVEEGIAAYVDNYLSRDDPFV